ncbi:hypothetical protein [Ensifer sp. SL37]|uniref:hypothetical protein n=1 Tax=Ensifer sp. SL37 TaxID=2995137 RepID=UPI0022724880|nr:hypothetical protein [Ensifer sp. SL37]MCY1740884.1 hypothetical protein [Ensifer sp. SL37]
MDTQSKPFNISKQKVYEAYLQVRSNGGAAGVRAGSVCLNSFGRFAKWISASIMLPPSSVSAR